MDEEDKISKLLGELKKVSAPKDFQFSVNARIAQGRPVAGVRGYFTFLKYAVPVAAMVLIVAMVAIETNFMYDADAVPAVAFDAGEINETPRIDETAAITVPVEDRTIVKENEEPVAEILLSQTNSAKTGGTVRGRASIKDRPTSSEGGSYDSASTEPSTKILPPVMIGNPPTPNVEIPRSEVPVSLYDLLGRLGIMAKQTGGVWSAAGIISGSLAERAGIKDGDIIDAIDAQKLNGKQALSSDIIGKQITVMREGKPVTLKLR